MIERYKGFINAGIVHKGECRRLVEHLFRKESIHPNGPSLPNAIPIIDKIVRPALQQLIAPLLGKDVDSVEIVNVEENKETYKVRDKTLKGVELPLQGFEPIHKSLKRLIFEVVEEMYHEGLIIKSQQHGESHYHLTFKGVQLFSQYEKDKWPLEYLNTNLFQDLKDLLDSCEQYQSGNVNPNDIFIKYRRVHHDIMIEIVTKSFTKLGLIIPSKPSFDPVKVKDTNEFMGYAIDELEKNKKLIRKKMAGEGSDLQGFKSILEDIEKHDLLTELKGDISLGKSDISMGYTGALVHPREVRKTSKCVEYVREQIPLLKGLLLRVDEMLCNVK